MTTYTEVGAIVVVLLVLCILVRLPRKSKRGSLDPESKPMGDAERFRNMRDKFKP